MIELRVYGQPAPQGSKRFVGVRGGRGVMVESSKAVKPWRQSVTATAVAHGARVEGPVEVEMVFTLRKPSSAPKTRVTWPDRKPDLSKLVRSTEDALTDAGMWQDDARVISCAARKVFPGEHPDALHTPGAVIRIHSVGGVK